MSEVLCPRCRVPADLCTHPDYQPDLLSYDLPDAPAYICPECGFVFWPIATPTGFREAGRT